MSTGGIRNKISNRNERIAVWFTEKVGSMGTFYLFLIYVLLPMLPMFRSAQDALLYWMNAIQLITLPLIMVGGNVVGRHTDAKAHTDYESLLAQMQELKKMHYELREILMENRVNRVAGTIREQK